MTEKNSNIEPTLLDLETLEELLYLENYGQVKETEKTTLRDESIKLLRRSNCFSDEKLGISKDRQTQNSKNSNDDIVPKENNSAYKIIAGIVLLIIFVTLVFSVRNKYKKMEEADKELEASGHNIQYDFFGEMRQKEFGKNLLITSEIILYLGIVLIIVFILKKILKTAEVVF